MNRSTPYMSYSSVARKTQARHHARFPMNGTIRLLWRDDQSERVLIATVINFSKNGLKVRVDQKIPVRAYVYCNSEALGIEGTASVRYCEFSKGRYDVGLEFATGLKVT